MLTTTLRPRVRALLFVAVAVIAASLPEAAQAGQMPNVGAIPPRAAKVREGDWVLYKTDEGFRLETATGSEQQENGDLMVSYTMQEVAANGRMGEEMEVVRTMSQERQELAALAQTLENPKLERRAGQIDGKRVNVYVLSDIREGFAIEYWYSDEFTIDGQVLMQVIVHGDEDNKPEVDKMFEVVGFGNAKTPLKNIRKYLR